MGGAELSREKDAFRWFCAMSGAPSSSLAEFMDFSRPPFAEDRFCGTQNVCLLFWPIKLLGLEHFGEKRKVWLLFLANRLEH